MIIESDLLRREIVALRKQVDTLSRRELPVSAVTLADGTVMRRSLQDKLKETVSATDFGAVADGVTDLAIALNRAFAVVAPGTIITVPPCPADKNYVLSSMVDWKVDDITLDVRGRINMTSTGRIGVYADRGTIRGGFWYHIPIPGQQSSGNLFLLKSILAADVIGHHTGWTVEDGVYINVTVRYLRVGRAAGRVPFVKSRTTAPVTPSDVIIPVEATIATLVTAGATHVRVTMDTGGKEVKEIVDIDPIALTLEVDTPFSNPVGSQRQISAAEILTAPVTMGDVTLHVSATTIFQDGMYARVVLDSGYISDSEVTGINPGAGTITVAPGVSGDAASGNAVISMTTGLADTGTDIVAQSTIRFCEIAHCRANYTVSLGGVDSNSIVDCYVHHAVRYTDPLNPKYFDDDAQILPTDDVDRNFGEAFKITAGSTNVSIERSRIFWTVRNMIDAYVGGGLRVINNIMRHNPFTSGLEFKWTSHDITPPQPSSIIGNTIDDIWQHAIIAGMPNSDVSDNIISRFGQSGVYVNGAQDESIDDEDQEGKFFTENVTVSANILDGNTDNSPILDPDSNSGTAILVTEVSYATIFGNIATNTFYGIGLLEGSNHANVTSNVVRDTTSGQGYRLRGDTTGVIKSSHRLTDNQGDAYNIDSFSTAVVVNGFSHSAITAGTTPLLADYQRGDLWRNDTDGVLWQHIGTAWQQASIGGGTTGRVAFWSNATALTTYANSIYWDSALSRLGIGTETPEAPIHAKVVSSNPPTYNDYTGNTPSALEVHQVELSGTPASASTSSFDLLFDPSGSIAARTFNALRALAVIPATNSTTQAAQPILRALAGSVRFFGHSAWYRVVGMQGTATNQSSNGSALTQVDAVSGQIQNSGTSSPITDAASLRAERPTGVAGNTTTNQYGLHIENQVPVAGTTTNHFGIYQAGTTDQNTLKGPVAFDNTTAHNGIASFNAGTIGIPVRFGPVFLAGVQVVANDIGANITVDVNTTLQFARLYAKTPSVGSALRVDIQRSTNGGTSFASLFSTLPQCLAASHIGGAAAVFSTTTVSVGDILRVDVTQIGSTTPGSDLTVQLFGVTR